MRSALRHIMAAALVLAAAVAPGADAPYLSGRVTDNAEILSDGARKSITGLLKAHEDKTGNQIAVLTIPSLGGESIEDYAVQVFASWKLGQKGRDNGVLVIVAPQDRRMRIEVGYGLEPVLTDMRAGRIIRSIMAPRFKDGDYDGGVEAGAKAIVELLETGGGTEPAGGSETGETGPSGPGLDDAMPDMPLAMRILMGAFIFGIIGLFTAIGVVTPGAGWFLYFFLIPFWAAFPMVIVGTHAALVLFIAYVVCFPIAKLLLKNRAWYKKAGEDLKTKGRASIGGFMLASGGGSWSSGSGGSSFSGGGGSSGGGGASGGW